MSSATDNNTVGVRAGDSEDLVIWSTYEGQMLLAGRCGECGGMGDFLISSAERRMCDHCHGHGWFGIDPESPVMAIPGSTAKMAMLAARYAAGVPLWNHADGPPRELNFLEALHSQSELASASFKAGTDAGPAERTRQSAQGGGSRA